MQRSESESKSTDLSLNEKAVESSSEEVFPDFDFIEESQVEEPLEQIRLIQTAELLLNGLYGKLLSETGKPLKFESYKGIHKPDPANLKSGIVYVTQENDESIGATFFKYYLLGKDGQLKEGEIDTSHIPLSLEFTKDTLNDKFLKKRIEATLVKNDHYTPLAKGFLSQENGFFIKDETFFNGKEGANYVTRTGKKVFDLIRKWKRGEISPVAVLFDIEELLLTAKQKRENLLPVSTDQEKVTKKFILGQLTEDDETLKKMMTDRKMSYERIIDYLISHFTAEQRLLWEYDQIINFINEFLHPIKENIVKNLQNYEFIIREKNEKKNPSSIIHKYEVKIEKIFAKNTINWEKNEVNERLPTRNDVKRIWDDYSKEGKNYSSDRTKTYKKTSLKNFLKIQTKVKQLNAKESYKVIAELIPLNSTFITSLEKEAQDARDRMNELLTLVEKDDRKFGYFFDDLTETMLRMRELRDKLGNNPIEAINAFYEFQRLARVALERGILTTQAAKDWYQLVIDTNISDKVPVNFFDFNPANDEISDETLSLELTAEKLLMSLQERLFSGNFLQQINGFEIFSLDDENHGVSVTRTAKKANELINQWRNKEITASFAIEEIETLFMSAIKWREDQLDNNIISDEDDTLLENYRFLFEEIQSALAPIKKELNKYLERDKQTARMLIDYNASLGKKLTHAPLIEEAIGQTDQKRSLRELFQIKTRINAIRDKAQNTCFTFGREQKTQVYYDKPLRFTLIDNQEKAATTRIWQWLMLLQSCLKAAGGKYGRSFDRYTGTMNKIKNIYNQIKEGHIGALEGYTQCKKLAFTKEGANNISEQADIFYWIVRNTELYSSIPFGTSLPEVKHLMEIKQLQEAFEKIKQEFQLNKKQLQIEFEKIRQEFKLKEDQLKNALAKIDELPNYFEKRFVNEKSSSDLEMMSSSDDGIIYCKKNEEKKQIKQEKFQNYSNIEDWKEAKELEKINKKKNKHSLTTNFFTKNQDEFVEDCMKYKSSKKKKFN